MTELYITGTNQNIIVHDEEDCSGKCAIHNPSDHILKEARTHWRDDRALMERICEHGIGHPDPDDLAYHQNQWRGIHSCDGCCVDK